MKFKKTILSAAIVSVAFIGGTLIGIFGYNFANAESNENQNIEISNVYKTNEYGETYGSAAYATSYETMPDLIWACGEDDISGYVRPSDLYGPIPKTPEEALATQNKLRKEGNRFIPLYDVDGKTVIGKYKISTEESFTVIKTGENTGIIETYDGRTVEFEGEKDYESKLKELTGI